MADELDDKLLDVLDVLDVLVEKDDELLLNELLELIVVICELEALLVLELELSELDLLDADCSWLLVIELTEVCELDVGNWLSPLAATWLEEVMDTEVMVPELVNPEPPELPPPPQAVSKGINKKR